MSWYYADEDGQQGPVAADELIRMVEAGRITGERLVWQEGMEDWQSLVSIPEFAELLPVPMSPVTLEGDGVGARCVACGHAFAESDMIAYEGRWICANCKDVFFQELREGVRTATTLNLASFWQRFCARFVDGVIVNIFVYTCYFALIFSTPTGDISAQSSSVANLMGILMVALSVGVPMLYDTFFIGKYGQSPGKKLIGIRVVRSDGSDLTYGRAFGRFWGYILSRSIAYIGCIMAAFDSEKRSLHDHICDTRVVIN